MKFIYYLNKIPRKTIFNILLTSDCIVFMFMYFDVSIWWGDSYRDLDYTGK